ncbi:MAG: hypothetical protein V9G08_00520 [Dermatophilaceae bacterium]
MVQASTTSPGANGITVSCPAGSYAIGGGGYTTDPNARQYYTRPLGGSSTAPATGWQWNWFTTGGSTGTYTVYAICSK